MFGDKTGPQLSVTVLHRGRTYFYVCGTRIEADKLFDAFKLACPDAHITLLEGAQLLRRHPD